MDKKSLRIKPEINCKTCKGSGGLFHINEGGFSFSNFCDCVNNQVPADFCGDIDLDLSDYPFQVQLFLNYVKEMKISITKSNRRCTIPAKLIKQFKINENSRIKWSFKDNRLKGVLTDEDSGRTVSRVIKQPKQYVTEIIGYDLLENPEKVCYFYWDSERMCVVVGNM